MGIYLPARQAFICTYFWCFRTDFDTLRTSCFIVSIISLDFNVYNLQNTYSLCLSSVPIDGSHEQLWVRWQPYFWYFQILCARTPRQCLKFRLWTSCIWLFWHLGFEMASRFLEKSVDLLLSEYILMFNFCVFARALWMNNYMYKVLNAGIPVIYIGMSTHILVKCVKRNSVRRVVWWHINTYIWGSNHIHVVCVKRHSVDRAVW
jgi:hypothetical protein